MGFLLLRNQRFLLWLAPLLCLASWGFCLNHDTHHCEDQGEFMRDQLSSCAEPAQKAYLLADAQPAIKIPSTDNEETAIA